MAATLNNHTMVDEGTADAPKVRRNIAAMNPASTVRTKTRPIRNAVEPSPIVPCPAAAANAPARAIASAMTAIDSESATVQKPRLDSNNSTLSTGDNSTGWRGRCCQRPPAAIRRSESLLLRRSIPPLRSRCQNQRRRLFRTYGGGPVVATIALKIVPGATDLPFHPKSRQNKPP